MTLQVLGFRIEGFGWCILRALNSAHISTLGPKWTLSVLAGPALFARHKQRNSSNRVCFSNQIRGDVYLCAFSSFGSATHTNNISNNNKKYRNIDTYDSLDAQLPIYWVPVLQSLYTYTLSVTQGPTIWVPGLLGTIINTVSFQELKPDFKT